MNKFTHLNTLILSICLVLFAAFPTFFAYSQNLKLKFSATTSDNLITTSHPVLNTTDIDTYKKIFSLQDKERWIEADKQISKLENNILLGYVLGQRYLNSSTWKTKSKETQSWMEKYSDLPFSGKIYDLGLQKGATFDFKKPKDVDKIPSGSCSSYTLQNPIDLLRGKSFAHLPDDKRLLAQRTMLKIISAINRGKTLIAYNTITSEEATSVLLPSEIDAAKIALAFLYFTDLRDDKALEVIEPAIKRSGNILPIGEWVAGLIYWRLGDYHKSATSFENAAQNPKTKAPLKSAAAYWAARSNFELEQKYEAQKWLEVSAETTRYFYGILARRMLGQEIEHEWEKPEPSDFEEQNIITKPAVQRAIALFQLGLKKQAEDELLKYYTKSSSEIKSSLISLCERYELLKLSKVMISLSGKMAGESKGVNYPAPHWKPLSDWNIRKSLIYAFVRQESCFNNQAISKAGAIGLMQLMPSTAKEVCKFNELEYSTKRLSEPSYNLEIGQNYIHKLINDKSVKGNLIFLAVAYNSGPGNLYRWQKRMDYKEDPLLFIESIPSKETRSFVQKILANYWIYSSLFGEDLTSLDEIIEGKWPSYTAEESDISNNDSGLFPSLKKLFNL